MSLTLNKSNACSVEGIPTSYSTLGGLTYVRGTVMATVGGKGLTPRNSHESVTVSMAINAQPSRSIDEDLLCVSSINIWLKMPNSRRTPLCLSGGDEFTKSKFKIASYLPQIHSMRLPNLIRVLCFLICGFELFTSCYFILSSLKLKLLGDCWILN